MSRIIIGSPSLRKASRLEARGGGEGRRRERRGDGKGRGGDGDGDREGEGKGKGRGRGWEGRRCGGGDEGRERKELRE